MKKVNQKDTKMKNAELFERVTELDNTQTEALLNMLCGYLANNSAFAEAVADLLPMAEAWKPQPRTFESYGDGRVLEVTR